MMNELQLEARTVAVKACVECKAGLLNRDKFCRWCGSPQPCQEGSVPNREGAYAVVTRDAAVCATVAFDAEGRTDLYRSVSGPLVSAVVTGALATPSREDRSAFIRQVILALISVPIWLIIVLLSPLDAYAAVRNVARQV